VPSRKYVCVLWRQNSAGFTWLGEERASVQAEVVDANNLECDAMQLSLDGWRPDIPKYQTSQQGLDLDVFFNPIWQSTVGWTAFYPASTMPIRVSVIYDSEDGNGTMMPMPNPLGYSAPQITDAFPRGMWEGSNITQAPASGGTPLEIYGAGLSGGFAQGVGFRLTASGRDAAQFAQCVSNCSSNPNKTNGTRPSMQEDTLSSRLDELDAYNILATVGDDGASRTPGIVFEIFAKRCVFITGLHVSVPVSGEQHMRVYHRSARIKGEWSTEHQAGSLSLREWTQIASQQVNGTLRHTSSCGHCSKFFKDESSASTANIMLQTELQLVPGSTHAFMVIGALGLRYLSTPAHASAVPTELADGFISIRPGRNVYARNGLGSLGPVEVEQVWGDIAAPRFFAGSVKYSSCDFGADYRCKFTMLAPGGQQWEHFSPIVKAAPVSAQLLSVASSVVCTTPSWDSRTADPFCVLDGVATERCAIGDVGSRCRGRCSLGGYVPVQGTCTGTCECGFFEILGKSVCASGVGTCECVPPNTGSECVKDADCTGEGKCNGQRGTCAFPMKLELQLANGTLVPYAGGSAPTFRVYPVWNDSIMATAVSAAGTEMITLTGSGFDVDFMAYKCLWILRNVSYSQVYSFSVKTEAVAQSSSRIVCNTPFWDYSASDVEVRVIGRDNVPLDFANSKCGNLLPSPTTLCHPKRIRIREEWNSVSPAQVFTGGGERITVYGYGFDSKSSDGAYSCTFSGSSNVTYAVPAEVLNSTIMVCRISFVATVPSAILLISHHNESVVFTGTARTCTFTAGWNTLVPSTGPLAGGADIVVSFFNEPTRDSRLDALLCVFDGTLRVNATLLNPSCRALNDTQVCNVKCVTPAIPEAPDNATVESRVTMVRIAISGEVLVPFKGLPRGDIFTFTNMASRESNTSITLLSGLSIYFSPLGDTSPITFEGAEASPLTFVGISEFTCEESALLWRENLRSSTQAVFANALNKTGVFIVCYTTGGRSGRYVAQTLVNLKSVAQVTDQSIQSIVPNQIGNATKARIIILGVEYSPIASISITASGTCSDDQMLVNGLPLQSSLQWRVQNVSGHGSFFPPEVDILVPNSGSYRLCYQYNRLGHNGQALKQRGPALTVIDSASLINSLSPHPRSSWEKLCCHL
jgi:hypothetical protein